MRTKLFFSKWDTFQGLRTPNSSKKLFLSKQGHFWPTLTNSNPVWVFSNWTWSVGTKKYQLYTKTKDFGKFGSFKAYFGKLGLKNGYYGHIWWPGDPIKVPMGTHDMAGCYWGLIGGLLGEKSGSRSPKWFQDLEGTPKPIPHRWHFPLGQNAYSEVQGATNGHHIHQVVGKLYVECDYRTFLISLEP